tara:strand:- start:205 stop:444 length:240 start_codon:yes stop_codon:yes gene_type:complete
MAGPYTRKPPDCLEAASYRQIYQRTGADVNKCSPYFGFLIIKHVNLTNPFPSTPAVGRLRGRKEEIGLTPQIVSRGVDI